MCEPFQLYMMREKKLALGTVAPRRQHSLFCSFDCGRATKSPEETTADFQASAGPEGLHIRNQIGSGFFTRRALTAVGQVFDIYPGETAIRLTIHCPIQGLLGFQGCLDTRM